MITDSFEAYKTYVALQRHFKDPKYDYQKYQGKIRVTEKAFQRRNDKILFYKLAKQKDIERFCLANFIDTNKTWIGDFDGTVYQKWEARQQALTYNIEQQLNYLLPKLTENIIVKSQQHPPLLKQYLAGNVTIELLIILNDLTMFFDYWSNNISDTVIWPNIRFKCEKYKPFVQYDKQTIRQKIFNHFSENSCINPINKR